MEKKMNFKRRKDRNLEVEKYENYNLESEREKHAVQLKIHSLLLKKILIKHL